MRGEKFTGNLCKRQHDDGTGHSQRYKNGGGCTVCQKLRGESIDVKEYKRTYCESANGKLKIKKYSSSEKAKEYSRRYNRSDRAKELKNSRRRKPEERLKINKYRSQLHVKQAENARVRKRRRTNPSFAVRKALGSRLADALRRQNISKKEMKIRGVVVDYKAIIAHLGPCPGRREKWHVDHIVPLCSFDLTDPLQMQEACKPSNHRWLLAYENRSKGGKLIAGTADENNTASGNNLSEAISTVAQL